MAKKKKQEEYDPTLSRLAPAAPQIEITELDPIKARAQTAEQAAQIKAEQDARDER
jgi:hypothetical protein